MHLRTFFPKPHDWSRHGRRKADLGAIEKRGTRNHFGRGWSLQHSAGANLSTQRCGMDRGVVER
jgi:hypothetical protein